MFQRSILLIPANLPLGFTSGGTDLELGTLTNVFGAQGRFVKFLEPEGVQEEENITLGSGVKFKLKVRTNHSYSQSLLTSTYSGP